MKTQHGFPDDVATMLKKIDEIGGPHYENHYPVPWCWAGSSPLKWMKQVASHFGGTRNPVVMSWPARIKDKRGLRSQFHHIIDIAPTILESAGIPEPRVVNGVPQRPIEGVSMVYTWDDAKAEGRRETQYFEMFGNRALYHKGWVAACRPRQASLANRWLVHLRQRCMGTLQHRSRLHRIPRSGGEGAEETARIAGHLHGGERAKFTWLDDRFAERRDVRTKPSYLRGKTRFTYLAGTTRIPETSSPPTKNVHHTIARSSN